MSLHFLFSYRQQPVRHLVLNKIVDPAMQQWWVKCRPVAAAADTGELECRFGQPVQLPKAAALVFIKRTFGATGSLIPVTSQLCNHEKINTP